MSERQRWGLELYAIIALVLSLGTVFWWFGLSGGEGGDSNGPATEDYAIVDIREPWEWLSTGVLEGSVLRPAFDSRGHVTDEFLDWFTGEFDRNGPVLLVCRTGSRTAYLESLLHRELGYRRVRSLVGGVLEVSGDLLVPPGISVEEVSSLSQDVVGGDRNGIAGKRAGGD